jgi:hypothetical protein
MRIACATQGCADPAAWQRAAGLRGCPAELAEQERQAAHDVGPVRRRGLVPQRRQRVEVREAFTERRRSQAHGQHTMPGR